jgi:hypothetical protein
VVLAAAAVLGVVLLLAQRRVGAPPTISIESGLPAIGRSTPVTVVVAADDRGLAGVLIELVQEGHAVELAAEHQEPRPFWAFWGPRVERREFQVTVGRNHQDWIEEGEASVQVTAARAPTWLHHPEPAVAAKTLPVRLRPPAVATLSTSVYAAQGGSEAVVYQVTGSVVKHGVQAGDWWFPGSPLPGGTPGQYFALFAVPYDVPDPDRVRLVASDDIGNTAQLPIIDRFFPKPVARETIEVNDSFLNRVVPAILSMTPDVKDSGDMLKTYLSINGDLRRRNGAYLVSLAHKSAPQFLWTKPFLQMRNTKVMSAFADHRTYLYQGRVVDEQDHLGFDLASTKQAEIPAANDGDVMLARYFGIYGNTVVIDHGYGLMTLYGHLSTIDVKEGDKVALGQSVGRSGATGLAGGDHLHFTMLLHGLPVTPVEWWDSHWIKDRIKRKLGDALPFPGKS